LRPQDLLPSIEVTICDLKDNPVDVEIGSVSRAVLLRPERESSLTILAEFKNRGRVARDHTNNYTTNHNIKQNQVMLTSV
jgi:hypothetical protein